MQASLTSPLPDSRHHAITLARQQWLRGDRTPAASTGAAAIDDSITRSWQRCLADGRQPGQRVVFESVRASEQRAAAERHQPLRAAAQPVLAQLARAIAGTRYFAMLTDARGQVIETAALSSGASRPARDIARVGLDLSEPAVGTTAIGLALAERRPVWLHRGEHFFDDTSIYTCAGAPLFDPQGDCAGMLDLTGVDVPERPELQHLAQQAAGAIGQALLLALPAALWLQFNWPGRLSDTLAGDTAAHLPERDGVLALDADGRILGANTAARQLLPLHAGLTQVSSDLFAVPPGLLFDAAIRHPATVELPLWSGLRLQARAWRPAPQAHTVGGGGALAPAPSTPRLRELQGRLIEQAVRDAHGSVTEAARALGVSRATVYRQLGAARRKP